MQARTTTTGNLFVRILKRNRHNAAEASRRFWAIAVSVLLCAQMLPISGISQAVADDTLVPDAAETLVGEGTFADGGDENGLLAVDNEMESEAGSGDGDGGVEEESGFVDKGIGKDSNSVQDDGFGSMGSEDGASALDQDGSSGESPDNAADVDVVRAARDLTADASLVLDARLAVSDTRPANVSVDDANLPDAIDAVLTLDIELDAGNVQPGDWFSVALPDELAWAGGDTKFDVLQNDERGGVVDERIAQAEVCDGVLRVTFGDGEESFASDDAVRAGAQAFPPTLRATMNLDVILDAALAGEEASTLDWLMRTDENGVPSIAVLDIPSAADIRAQWGMVDASHAEEGLEGNGHGESSEIETSANAVLGSALSDVGESTEKRSVSDYSFIDSMRTIWCDNNSSKRPSAEKVNAGYVVTFTIEGDPAVYTLYDANGALTQGAMAVLGLADEHAIGPVSTVQDGTGQYTTSTPALPTKLTIATTTTWIDEDGIKQSATDTQTKAISYAFADRNSYEAEGAYENYTKSSKSEDGIQYLQLLEERTFAIKGKIGEESLAEVLGDYALFDFHAYVDNKALDEGEGVVLKDLVDYGTLTVSLDGGAAVISGRLPAYNYENYPIDYAFTYMGAQNGDDYYQASYDNGEGTNHGSDTSAMYAGGTLTLTHAGSTTFTAQKVWLDNGGDERPDTTWTLWRYAAKKGVGAPNASQVRLDSAAGKSGEYVSFTVPGDAADENGAVNLGTYLAENYGGSNGELDLPKYDPDGYPYVYGLREEVVAGYEQVFGEVASDGSVADTAPGYAKPDNSSIVRDEDYARTDADRFVYRNGTISNRLTGTVEVAQNKTWIVAAFQNQLEDVVCTFQAQSRPEGSDGAWTDVEGTGAVRTIDGFIAEALTQEVAGTFPAHSARGEKLEYRWVEVNVQVKQEDGTLSETGFASNADYTQATFALTLEDAEGNPEELAFTSTLDADGTIVNTFENTTVQHVDKWWEQTDGSFEQVKPDPDYDDGVATVKLFQDDTLIGTFTLDGTPDAEPYAIANPDGTVWCEGATYQETSSYHLDFAGLPKYSETGHKYSYLVLEVADDKWHVERAYDAESQTTDIYNYFPEGEGSEMYLSKKWIDGDDAAHRLDCVVAVYARHDMASQSTDPQSGKPRVSYKAGDYVTTVVLTENQAWFAEFDVGIGGLDESDFAYREVGMGAAGSFETDAGGEEASGDAGDASDIGVAYKSYTKDEALAAYGEAAAGIDWINTGWTNETRQRIATDNHVYEVLYPETVGGADGDYALSQKGSYEITNRRLGLIDLDVTKVWQDGLGDLREGDDNPRDGATAALVLNCDAGDVFIQGEGGTAYVMLSGGNRLQITNATQKPDGSGKEPQTGLTVMKDGKPVAAGEYGNEVSVKVDTTKAESTYTFHGLPKYDGDGVVAHYDIEERWDDEASHGDYRSTLEKSDYAVGERHFHDTQAFSFKNLRSGTKDVSFYKHWKDAYVYGDLNQRPDIYLTLYKVSKDSGDKPQVVDGYIHWLWVAVNDGESTDYKQKCVIADLPKYDAQGDEITYYAVESMNADGVSLHYQPVTFSDEYGGIGDAEDAPLISVEDGAEADMKTASGQDYALHEGGTFTNVIASDIKAEGTKIWENIPGNVAEADLPGLTVFIQQRLKPSDGSDEWPSLYVEKNMSGTGSHLKPTDESIATGGAIAWTSTMKRVENNQYTYTVDRLGDNTVDGALFEQAASLFEGLLQRPLTQDGGQGAHQMTLPKYDEDGNLYEYRAREVIWGLVGSDAGIGWDELGSIDFSTTELVSEGGKVFRISHGETGSFVIRNAYNPEKGNLTVEKRFEGRAGGDHFPDVTFDVYRYYIGADGESAHEKVASHTMTAEDFAAADKDGDGNPSLAYTFEDLGIYAPNGSYWQYYVVEQVVGGYKTTVAIGQVPSDADFKEGEAYKGGDTVIGYTSGNLCPDDGTVIASDKTVDVTFKNSYEPSDISMNGQKTWDDYSNAFGSRPDSLVLTLTRTSATGQVETVFEDYKADKSMTTATSVGSTVDEDVTFYWTEAGDDNWTYTIDGLEEFAPDGSRWTYRITEQLPDGTQGYRIVVGAGTGTGTAKEGGAISSLVNALEGKVGVEKDWNDGDNEYGLRPDSVTVELRARLYDENGTFVQGSDGNAYAILSSEAFSTATKESLEGVGLTEDSCTATLNAGTKWKYAWQPLPTAIRNSEGAAYSVKYYVVETKVGDVEIAAPTVTDADGGISVRYGEEGALTVSDSYTTVQKNSGDANAGYATLITNTLETTRLTATKKWDDQDNAYGTRPNVSTDGTWTLELMLQRTTTPDDDNSWAWVTKFGTTAGGSEDYANENIVRVTISGKKSEDSATFENLPKYDGEGEEYTYRVVEKLPDGYAVGTATSMRVGVDGAMLWVPQDSTGATIEGSSDEGFKQVPFVNRLMVTDLSGTKQWSAYGEDTLLPDFDDGDYPTMTLYRSTDENATTGEKVAYAKNGGQPEWEKASDGTGWTFAYEDLPRTDDAGKAYYYWAEETAGSVDGFYPVYGTAGAGGTSVSQPDRDKNTTQTGTTITNTATRFTLDKVNDWQDGEALDGVELSVMNEAGTLTYAVWARDASGNVSSIVWPDGTANVDDGTGITMDGQNKGYVVGLKAGGYIIRETGEVPEGHAIAKDVKFAIAANGAISATDSSALEVTGSNPGGTLMLTATDPVFRGHIQLTKTTDDGKALADAVFELWRVGMGQGGADEKVAEGITTGADGIWSSKDDGAGVEFLTKEDGKRTHLSDGLLPGTYYFVETGYPDTVHQPDQAVKSTEAIIAQENGHGATATVAAENELFSASATLMKYDADHESHAGIADAEFTLEYRANDGEEYKKVGTYKTGDTSGENGVLTLALDKKGDYRLTETANTGYDAEFAAEFAIENADHGKTLDLADADDQKAIDFKVTQGAMTSGEGVPNDRLPGSVTMYKSSTISTSTPLNGAVFTLMKQTDEGWTAVVEGLETGKSYTLNDANTAIDGTPTKGEDGTLTVGNLAWGTYKFVETSSTDGYLTDEVESKEFTIGRTSLTASLIGSNAVTNQPTYVTVIKKNADGTTLSGAQFSVTPEQGSAFVDGTTAAKPMKQEGSLHRLTAELVVGDTYTIAETKAPTGYRANPSTLTFTVREDGSLEVVGEMPDGWQKDATSEGGWQFIAIDEPVEITIKKVDADTGEPLSGAKFRLKGTFANKSTSQDFVTGEDGTYAFDSTLLIGGNEYTLLELSEGAPAGYLALDETVTFVIDENSGLARITEQDENSAYALSEDGLTLTVSDTPTRLVMMKVDGGGNPLKGAVFSVAPADGTTFADGSTEAIELTTGGKGGAARLDAQLIVGGTYDIAEVKAPDGYEVIKGTLSVTVVEDGSLAVNGTLPAGYTKSDANEFTIQAVDTPVVAGIQKVSTADGGTMLAGAQFVIEGRFADGSTTQTLTTVDGGVVNLEGLLVAGVTYTVAEVKAAEGYELIEGSFSFMVNDDGTLSAAEGSKQAADGQPGFVITNEGNVALTAADAPISIDLAKRGADGSKLAGAIFALTGVFAGGSGQETREYATDAEGAAHFGTELVAGNAYTLTEAQSPEGYEVIGGSLTFKVNDDGTIAAQGDVPAGYAIEAGGVAIAATDTPIEIEVRKVGENAQALSGAQFTLSAADGSTLTDGRAHYDFTVGEEGGVTLSNLLIADNSYTLTETVAPQGYEVIEGSLAFTVNADGTVTAVGAPQGYAISDDGLTVTATDTPIEVRLKKVNEAGETLSGATFALAGIFVGGTEQETREYTTGEDGIIALDAELAAGNEYVLAEVAAPQGYVPIEDTLTFTVGSDGTIAAAGGIPDEYSIGEDGASLIVENSAMPNEPGRFSKTNDSAALLTLGMLTASACALLAMAGALRRRRIRRR